MAYQGIIFDFNEVLWWDSQLQEQAWREFAREHFEITLTNEMMEIEVHGRNNQHTLEYLAGTPLTDQQGAQLSGQKEALYRTLCLAQGDGFKLSPGADDLLDALRAQEVPRTIATASGHDNRQFFIEHLQLERWFDAQLIAYDDGTRPGKPAADIYLQAAHLIELHPGDCVVVEDSMAGIQAARSAGIGYIIAMVSRSKDPTSSRIEGVDHIIENMTEIPWEKLFYNSGSKTSSKKNGAVDNDGHQNE